MSPGTRAGSPERPRVPPNCDLALGLRCVEKSEPGRSVWSMAADERFANPVGQVQGGVLAALADSAMAASTISWARGQHMRVTASTTDLDIRFLRPARAGEDATLTCTARVRSGGRRIAFGEAEIVDERATLVATATATYLLTPRERQATQRHESDPED